MEKQGAASPPRLAGEKLPSLGLWTWPDMPLPLGVGKLGLHPSSLHPSLPPGLTDQRAPALGAESRAGRAEATVCTSALAPLDTCVVLGFSGPPLVSLSIARGQSPGRAVRANERMWTEGFAKGQFLVYKVGL